MIFRNIVDSLREGRRIRRSGILPAADILRYQRAMRHYIELLLFAVMALKFSVVVIAGQEPSPRSNLHL
jgi:hypothetical protein